MAFSPKRAGQTKENKKAVAGAPQPEKTDNKDLTTTVYRRTTRRQNTSTWAGEDFDEHKQIHAARSFLEDLLTYLILSKAVRVYTGQAKYVKAYP